MHVDRVFKKSAPNSKLTLYLSSRDLVISDSKIDKLQGVLLVDPDYLQDRKVYGQVTLTFRYGREDEEVMGLKFCNEAVMCLAQLYPPHERALPYPTTPLQEALIKRLGPNAHPFTMEVTPLAPPSVQLVPAKEYSGAPIGTSYDVRAYVAERADEKLHRRSTVRMGIRVLQQCLPSAPGTVAPSIQQLAGPPPHATVEKPFLLSDGRVELEASLDKSVYSHGESIIVFVVQHVDVCMFSNGKFKNVVALVTSHDECPIGPGASLNRTYTLHPVKGATKNWIALEDSFNRAGASLASTVTCTSNSPDDRNVFAIYVSYYVKVKLLVGAIGGELSLKLPFKLTHTPSAEMTESPRPGVSSDKKSAREEEDVILKCDEEPT
ncbi:hypothetical protein L9F63_008556 [Diploptera punctata]|uniref:Arrestin C-terminal-like domain-containing protein n=1 Tax=Diploptera punctata TaxID=6984 RepID=A0AAD8E1K8_DIPPU|nr:hypothetical protein L9F63_008556 [Diploptera punctata]